MASFDDPEICCFCGGVNDIAVRSYTIHEDMSHSSIGADISSVHTLCRDCGKRNMWQNGYFKVNSCYDDDDFRGQTFGD